jgi:site-specific DNA-methyltransferase (adenine-specific)
MTPYYDDGTCVIYHGDCREMLPDVAPLAVVSFLIADPPYGIKVDTAFHSRGRGKPSAKSTHVGRNRLAKANEFPPVFGDDEPFDPSHLLAYKRLVLWGAHNYAHLLPPSPSWIVWDRVSGGSATADAELAWTNLGGTVRGFRYQWNGACRQGEKETHGLHPTQKPVALMAWIIARWTKPGDLILDPYMGSGPVLRAAKDLGRRAVGIEIDERYCEIAAHRLGQEVLAL